LQVWLRLTLAAFLLAVYTVIAMAGGVARADDDPSASGGESGTKGATSQQSGPQKSGSGSSGTDATSHPAPPADVEKPAKVDPSKPGESDPPSTGDTSITTPKTKPPKATAATEPTTAATATDTTHSDPISPPQSTPVGTTASETPPTPETPPLVVPEEGSATTDSPGVDVEPAKTLPTNVSHDSKRPSQPASVAAPASAEPRPTATVESNVRSLRPQVDPDPVSDSVRIGTMQQAVSAAAATSLQAAVLRIDASQGLYSEPHSYGAARHQSQMRSLTRRPLPSCSCRR